MYLDFAKGYAGVKGYMCSVSAVNCSGFLVSCILPALSMLRNDLKMYERLRTGSKCSAGQRVKIDGDSGAAVSLVTQVPVDASPASRAMHICNNLRFGQSGSSAVFSVSETNAN